MFELEQYSVTCSTYYISLKFKVKNVQQFSHFTVVYGKEAENRCVLSLFLNDRRQLDDVTSGGKLFQVLDAETRNAQSLIVESRVGGRTSAEVDMMNGIITSW